MPFALENFRWICSLANGSAATHFRRIVLHFRSIFASSEQRDFIIPWTWDVVHWISASRSEIFSFSSREIVSISFQARQPGGAMPPLSGWEISRLVSTFMMTFRGKSVGNQNWQFSSYAAVATCLIPPSTWPSLEFRDQQLNCVAAWNGMGGQIKWFAPFKWKWNWDLEARLWTVGERMKWNDIPFPRNVRAFTFGFVEAEQQPVLMVGCTMHIRWKYYISETLDCAGDHFVPCDLTEYLIAYGRFYKVQWFCPGVRVSDRHPPDSGGCFLTWRRAPTPTNTIRV